MLTLSIIAFPANSSVAQFLPPLQAASRAEFDDYLDLLDSPTTRAKVESTSRFAEKWPQSELLPQVYQWEAEARRALGDGKGARRAAEKALGAGGDNIPALVFLSEVIGNDESGAGELATAGNYARAALKLLSNFRAPRSLPLMEWETARDRMRSRIHASLGLIAFKRDQPQVAIQELEAAEAIMPEPDPVILYRLGRLYREAGRVAEAIAKLKRVAQMEEPTLSRLANDELRSMK